MKWQLLKTEMLAAAAAAPNMIKGTQIGLQWIMWWVGRWEGTLYNNNNNNIGKR